MGRLIADKYAAWQAECDERFKQLKANEEELNRIFIKIYGLQDELTPDVADKDVTVRRADLQREIKSLLSYAVGCMMGRYSLDIKGLVYAGGTWDASKYKTFPADEDGILPVCDTAYFADDVAGRFVEFVKTVYGEDTLEENLNFVAAALGNKGSNSREVIRSYFLNDFYQDHLKIYQKRPIYWLLDSGKQDGFKALIYLHRYTPDTLGVVRTKYLHRMEEVYEQQIELTQDTIDHSPIASDVGKARKRQEKLRRQLKECQDYDTRLGHLAMLRTALDLDDGVKVNYDKLQTDETGKNLNILAKI